MDFKQRSWLGSTQQKVLEFHQLFVPDQVSAYPCLPVESIRLLRLKLIFEEASELASAFGFSASFMLLDRDGLYAAGGKAFSIEGAEHDRVAMAADACGDIDYVVQGTNVACGFPGGAVIDAIHAANIAKLGPDGKPIYREDGKVLKPKGWQPPDIAAVLERYMRRFDGDRL